MPDLAAKIPELEQKLKRSMWRPAIVFRALNEHEIAFRNNFGSRNAMSGLIRLEPSQGRIRISGNLYWMFFMLPFLFLFLGSLLMSMNIGFMVFMLAIILVTVIQQRYQYGQIAAVIVATAVSAPSSTWQTPEIGGYTPQTTEFNPKSYEPILYDPQSKKPQTGLTNVEVALIIILGSLIIIACAAAFLFFSGA